MTMMLAHQKVLHDLQDHPETKQLLQQAAHPAHEPDGGVADAHHLVPEHGAHRLGDDSGRVGEVDDPGRGRDLGDHAGGLEGQLRLLVRCCRRGAGSTSTAAIR